MQAYKVLAYFDLGDRSILKLEKASEEKLQVGKYRLACPFFEVIDFQVDGISFDQLQDSLITKEQLPLGDRKDNLEDCKVYFLGC